jgi:hypothetical protein
MQETENRCAHTEKCDCCWKYKNLKELHAAALENLAERTGEAWEVDRMCDELANTCQGWEKCANEWGGICDQWQEVADKLRDQRNRMEKLLRAERAGWMCLTSVLGMAVLLLLALLIAA